MIPDWILLLLFWIHMLVTVVWLGSFGAYSLVIFPLFRKRLSKQEYSDWFVSSAGRLIAISWLSASFLTLSGLFQMSENPNYEGFLGIGNLWSLAILIKHLVFFAMLILSALMSWKYFPALKKGQLLRKAEKANNEMQIIGQIEKVVRINVWLGGITLALTALARIS